MHRTPALLPFKIAAVNMLANVLGTVVNNEVHELSLNPKSNTTQWSTVLRERGGIGL